MHQTWNATRVLFKSIAGLLKADARQEAVLVFYSVFSSLESSCLYCGMVFLFLVLKNPSCCRLVSLLQLEGSFLLVCRHMSGSCHKQVLEEISLSLSPSLFLPFFNALIVTLFVVSGMG